jgi:hypothetical protein
MKIIYLLNAFIQKLDSLCVFMFVFEVNEEYFSTYYFENQSHKFACLPFYKIIIHLKHFIMN